jgi:uncharacterized membrane protein HdeD (DUF308 family)
MIRHHQPWQEPDMNTTVKGPGSTSPPNDLNQLSAALVQNWWLIALRGALAVVFGIIALAMPVATILALVLLFSAFMLVDAAFSFVAAIRAGRRGGRWGLLSVQGIASLAAGVIAFVWPEITVVAFILLIAAWSIVTGTLLLSSAVRVDNNHGRWWFALGGVAATAFGVLMIVAPMAGAIVLTWWLGVFALAFGATLLVVAFRLRSRRMSQPGRMTARAVS